MFLRNLLLNEKNELYNRNLHIRGLWETEKVDIDLQKVDIKNKKVDIESVFSEKAKDFSAKTVNKGTSDFETPVSTAFTYVPVIRISEKELTN